MKQPYDILQEQFTELRKLYEAMKEANRRLQREKDSFREKLAYVTFERNALLEMTWLDLPSEPVESTKRWREAFEKGWVRK